MNEEDRIRERVLWLAGVVCSPDRSTAADVIMARTKLVADADRLILQSAWSLLSMETGDSGAVVHPVVAGAIGLLCLAEDDTHEARARLRVWDDAARGKYDPTMYSRDLFVLAEIYWRGEMQRIVATPGKQQTRPSAREKHPALMALLMDRWDDAYEVVRAETMRTMGPDFEVPPSLAELCDPDAANEAVAEMMVEKLYSAGTPAAGALALAWSMLAVDPTRPGSFWPVMPQLQRLVDDTDLPPDDEADLRARLRIWWHGAEAEWRGTWISIFRIAGVETRRGRAESDEDTKADPSPAPTTPSAKPDVETRRGRAESDDAPAQTTPSAEPAPAPGPTLVVMPSAKASKLKADHVTSFRNILDRPLPLVVARDVAGVRRTLLAEYPHAATAIDIALRDLREANRCA